jgi:transcriptional regulator with XRE-family HTH domain
LTAGDARFLKKLGLRINADLYKEGRPVEWLAFRVGIARSSIREIIAGRSNPRLLTLQAIAEGLGYKNLIEFLKAV